MARSNAFLTVAVIVGAIGALTLAPNSLAQRDTTLLDPEQAELQLERARQEAAEAEARATRLAADAEAATRAADRTAKEAAAIAAQIQRLEAEIAFATSCNAAVSGTQDGKQQHVA